MEKDIIPEYCWRSTSLQRYTTYNVLPDGNKVVRQEEPRSFHVRDFVEWLRIRRMDMVDFAVWWRTTTRDGDQLDLWLMYWFNAIPYQSALASIVKDVDDAYQKWQQECNEEEARLQPNTTPLGSKMTRVRMGNNFTLDWFAKWWKSNSNGGLSFMQWWLECGKTREDLAEWFRHWFGVSRTNTVVNALTALMDTAALPLFAIKLVDFSDVIVDVNDDDDDDGNVIVED